MTPVRHAAIAALCTAAFTVGAFAQTPISTSPKPTATVGVVPPPKPPIPDTVLFRFFFLHVNAIKSLSDQAVAAGKGPSTSRGQIMKLLRTNDTEASLIEETSTSCTAQLNSHAKATAAQRATLIQQFKQGDAAAASDANRQGTQLDADRDKLITDCMHKLQSGLGDPRYQQVKAAVYFSEGPKITIQPLKTDSGSTATTPAPVTIKGAQ